MPATGLGWGRKVERLAGLQAQSSWAGQVRGPGNQSGPGGWAGLAGEGALGPFLPWMAGLWPRGPRRPSLGDPACSAGLWGCRAHQGLLFSLSLPAECSGGALLPWPGSSQAFAPAPRRAHCPALLPDPRAWACTCVSAWARVYMHVCACVCMCTSAWCEAGCTSQGGLWGPFCLGSSSPPSAPRPETQGSKGGPGERSWESLRREGGQAECRA